MYIFPTADHEVKRQYDKGDWLLYFLGSDEAGNTNICNKLEYNVKCIATMLYSIIFIAQDDDAIKILAGSLGSDAKASQYQQKRYLDDIAGDTVHQHVQNRSSSKSNRYTYNSDNKTTTTGSFTQLSSSELNCINNGDTTTIASRHVNRQAPPAITTTNIENNVGLMSDDGISPLKMQSGTPSKFNFNSSFGDGNGDGMGFDSPCSLKDTQHISRNCDGDGDGDSNGMAFDSSSPKAKRSRCTGTPLATKGNG